MKTLVGINGFGRFGLHLLKYWLDRNASAGFALGFINDDTLTIEQAYQILTTDKYVHFNKYKVKIQDNALIFSEPNGARHAIQYSRKDKAQIPWLEQVRVVFECSGKNTARKDCESYLRDKKKIVLVSATSWDADKTLVYGFNHTEFNEAQRVISYGSCTVNAYVPIANYIHKRYGVQDSDFNVIHNIQDYRLKDNYSLNRKFCTLEKSGPSLLKFINESNFVVNYTVIPYNGVSMLDFRFKLKAETTREQVIEDLEKAFTAGELKHLYSFDEVDIGPEVYNCTTYSTVFIKENAKLISNNLYLHGYFDNENSVNRYFDLADYICEKLKD
jgi:glyceraldehyde 3-phosphate dehydrogenase